MKRILFVVAAIMIGSHSFSQQDSTGKVLDEVILTANKFEQKQSTTGKVVTVISSEQIQKSAGKTVAQVLNEQAGIFITGANNNTGSVQTIFMRGASSGRALILVDGIPVNDPSMIYNEFDLNLFSINDVERIEICKGSQSTLYGSDAIAGVINIITIKKDINKPVNLKATSAFGNKNTVRNNIQVYGNVGKLNYTTRFAKLSTDGFSSANDKSGNANFDKDGFDGNVVNAALQYRVIPELSLRTFILHSRYKADVDAAVFKDDKDYTIRNTRLASGAGADFKKGIVNIVGNYQYGELSRSYRNDSLHISGFNKFESNKYKGRTQYAELYGNITTSGWLTILAGFDYRWANMTQNYLAISSFGPYTSSFPDTSAHQTSFYGSLLFSFLQKRLNAEIGGRSNKHSRYGTNSTYTFNPSFIINGNWRIFGSIASGFKAPSIFQVYDAFSGNKDLTAEKSVNYEAGIQHKHEKFRSRLVYFRRNIKNGIDFNYTTFKYFNFVKQTVKGVELELSTTPVKQLNITANYTFINAQEQTQSRKDFNDTSYNYLLRRPKNTFNVTISYQVCPELSLSVSGRSAGKRYDVGGYQADDVLLSKYFLLNAYGEYKWKNNLKFFVDLQNITNKKFFDIYGYNSIPFMINGGIVFNL